MAFEIDITRVRVLLTKDFEPLGMGVVDMIYILDEPHFVFEWSQRDDGQHIPNQYYPINPEFLVKLPDGSDADYLYQMPYEDPRATTSESTH
jgi:hypothetical protein